MVGRDTQPSQKRIAGHRKRRELSESCTLRWGRWEGDQGLTLARRDHADEDVFRLAGIHKLATVEAAHEHSCVSAVRKATGQQQAEGRVQRGPYIALAIELIVLPSYSSSTADTSRPNEDTCHNSNQVIDGSTWSEPRRGGMRGCCGE